MARMKENRHTLSGIVHVLNIRALPLIAIPIVGVIEAVILKDGGVNRRQPG